MAIGIDKSRMKCLVIFNEISNEYCMGEDIECRFYTDSGMCGSDDKIGLYKVEWSDKNEFIMMKDFKDCKTDEFGEKCIIFGSNQMHNQMIGQEFQFCFFHLNNGVFELSAMSSTFRMKSRFGDTVDDQNSEYSPHPTAPETSIYPTLECVRNMNQTIPKVKYNTNPEGVTIIDNNIRDMTLAQTSVEQLLVDKEREFAETVKQFEQKDQLKDLEIERLQKVIKGYEEKLASLESDLNRKFETEKSDTFCEKELMDTLRMIEAKNTSLEEILVMRDRDLIELREKCLTQEEIIDELENKLVITQSELDSDITHGNENKFLIQKIQEIKSKYEKVKNIKEVLLSDKFQLEKNNTKIEIELQVMKDCNQDLKAKLYREEENNVKLRAELQANELIARQSRDIVSCFKSSKDVILQSKHSNPNITLYVNDMKQDMKDYVISQSCRALKSLTDVKSIAESIVRKLNETYGKSWLCLIGQEIQHSHIFHVIGTYISFAVEDIKIIVFKTIEMLNVNDVISSAQNSKQINFTFKSDWIEPTFETLITSLVMESIDEEIIDYSDICENMTKVLQNQYSDRYGDNWLVIAGLSQYFDSNFLMSDRRYIEVEIGRLKIIVAQTEAMTRFKSKARNSKISN